jgi:hypothetical protein
VKQKDHPTLTETEKDGLVLTCVCGNRVQVVAPGVRADPTWGFDGLQCSNCGRMYAVLPGGEIFQYPSSEEEYQEVVKQWELPDDFKALLVANLRNPTEARIDALRRDPTWQ